MEETKGLIFDIQRFSLHDGPGIRTTVFLKGCPLSCVWCHNPESRSSAPEIAFYRAKCIGCGRCVEACPNDALGFGEERIDRAKCRVCGECVQVCPSEAVQMAGRVTTISEILGVAMRDQPFYTRSGGGVTLSGGEPLHQFEFSHSLLAALKDHGLHTAVETCGLSPWERIAGLLPFTDLFLYDIKVVSSTKHQELCKADNSTILDNARKLAAKDVEIVFRTPIIPGLNDTPDDLRRLGEFILSLPGERKLELMPYHRIGSGKYEALGERYPLFDIEAPDNLDEQKAALTSMGVKLVFPNNH
ncbi:MAG TPA: glycyl-radical enzyme activating protein [Armatimonadota bacterium]|nr:glycyl-radical enzyme activating protein [Armatimonadota bacterium]